MTNSRICTSDSSRFDCGIANTGPKTVYRCPFAEIVPLTFELISILVDALVQVNRRGDKVGLAVVLLSPLDDLLKVPRRVLDDAVGLEVGPVLVSDDFDQPVS